MTSAIVAAYTEYVKARKQAKEDFKASLPGLLGPHLVTLGEAVEEAQRDGMPIAEIARVMGVKYRNIIYEAKRAYAQYKGVDPNIRDMPVRTPNPKQEEQAEQVAIESDDYTIQSFEKGNYEVFVWGEEYILNTDERTGRVIIPDEWADASDVERAVYKKIVKSIESGEADEE